MPVALALMAGSLLLLVALGPVVSGLGAAGVVVAELCALAGPALLYALRHRPLAAAVGLRRPHRRALLGAVLVGLSFWYLSLYLIVPWARRLGGDDPIAELGRELGGDAGALPWRLLCFALVPALCEELLVRGAILGALRPAVGRALAVTLAAGFFGLLHGSPARAIPAACFGMALGDLALASGSLWPAIAAHAVNNTAVLVLSTSPVAAWADRTLDHPWLGVPVAGLATVCGLTIARQRGVTPETLR